MFEKGSSKKYMLLSRNVENVGCMLLSKMCSWCVVGCCSGVRLVEPTFVYVRLQYQARSVDLTPVYVVLQSVEYFIHFLSSSGACAKSNMLPHNGTLRQGKFCAKSNMLHRRQWLDIQAYLLSKEKPPETTLDSPSGRLFVSEDGLSLSMLEW